MLSAGVFYVGCPHDSSTGQAKPTDQQIPQLQGHTWASSVILTLGLQNRYLEAALGPHQ